MDIFDELFQVILDRKKNPVKDSYTCKLLREGDEMIVRKFGEESLELIMASLSKNKKQIVHESADLIYHLFVLLASNNIDLEDVKKELERRRR